jgi:hypothetical protein
MVGKEKQERAESASHSVCISGSASAHQGKGGRGKERGGSMDACMDDEGGTRVADRCADRQVKRNNQQHLFPHAMPRTGRHTYTHTRTNALTQYDTPDTDTHTQTHTLKQTRTSRVSYYLVSEHYSYAELFRETGQLAEKLAELHLPSGEEEDEEEEGSRKARKGHGELRRG